MFEFTTAIDAFQAMCSGMTGIVGLLASSKACTQHLAEHEAADRAQLRTLFGRVHQFLHSAAS